MTISETLGATDKSAEAITQLRFEDIPPEVIEKAKLAILDTIGVTVAGADTSTGQIMLELGRRMGTASVATVIGSDFRAEPSTAALINGVTGHALDYDDVSWPMIGHPSVAVLPAVLAIAEERGLSGRDVVAAYCLGFDFAAKLGEIMNPSHYEQGWHATGTLGTMGAAAAACNAMRLNVDQTKRALGIATSLAAGVRQNFGTDTKPFHAGSAARAGVLSAQLAELGLTSDNNILEERWGFFKTFSGPAEVPAARKSLEEFAKRWDLIDPGVLLKMYPTGVSTHTSIDATLTLCRENDIQADQVESVEVGVVYLSTMMLIHDRPTTGLEGKFSMPYCVARAILDRSILLEHFTDAAVQQDKAQDLLRRVQMKIDPAVNDVWRLGLPRGAIVTIRLRDGQTYSCRVDIPSGNPSKLELDQLLAKFRDCTRSLGETKQAELIKQLLNLEAQTDVRAIMGIISR